MYQFPQQSSCLKLSDKETLNKLIMKFGLIGYPIAHSLSPSIFKAGYNGKYPYELIEEQDFEAAYQRFLNDYDGINVTAPFKETALKKADIISEECRIVGATNLLVKTPAGVAAYNSDYRGLVMLLKEISDRQSTVLIVGFGGAGKAAAAAADASGHKTVILNRTRYSQDILPLDAFREEFRKADIIIYNLPVGIPQMEELTEEDFCPGHSKVLLEANYRNPSFDKDMIDKAKFFNPLFTRIEGKKWLLYQALAGYELFTGEKPDLSRMSDVL